MALLRLVYAGWNKNRMGITKPLIHKGKKWRGK